MPGDPSNQISNGELYRILERMSRTVDRIDSKIDDHATILVRHDQQIEHTRSWLADVVSSVQRATANRAVIVSAVVGSVLSFFGSGVILIVQLSTHH